MFSLSHIFSRGGFGRKGLLYHVIVSFLGLGFLSAILAIFILISAWSFSYSGPKGIIIISLLTAVAVFQIARVFLKERSELAKAQQELEEDKQVLEIKVKARTKELEEINAQLEKTIEQRTRELKAQIEELERFHRLVVGRELKMIELKKEIQDLKEELEYYKERKLAKTAKSK